MKAALALLMLAIPFAVEAQPLSLAEARGMTREALAQRVLGRARPEFRETFVYSRSFPMETGTLDRIVFAEAPRFSGFAGICEARTVEVPFADSPEATRPTTSAAGPPQDATAAFSASWPPESVRTSWRSHAEAPEEVQRFRIVGTAPGGPVTATQRARYERSCAAAGSVMGPGVSSRGARFFRLYDETASTAADVDFAVRVLRQAQKAAIEDRHVPECRRSGGGRDPMCANPAAALAHVRWDRLELISFDTAVEGPGYREIRYYFRRYTSPLRGNEHLEVAITVQGTIAEPFIESVEIVGVAYVD